MYSMMKRKEAQPFICRLQDLHDWLNLVFVFKWGMIEQELDFIRRRLSFLYSSRDFFGYYLFMHLISLETASAQKLWAVCHSSDVQSVLVIEPGNALATDQALVL